jgi:hypothetical protein
MTRCKCGREDTLEQTDSYTHGDLTVEVYDCVYCERTGAMVHHVAEGTYQHGCIEDGRPPVRQIDLTAPLRAVARRLAERFAGSTEGRR